MTLISVPASNGSPELCIDDGGSNRLPVLFVHSLAGTSSHWSEQLESLRCSRRALAIDLRGHGRSASPKDGDYSIGSLARDIDSVVKHFDLQQYVLVGHSMGASACIAHAGSHLQRVAGLLLVDPSGDARQVPAEQKRQFLAALESESYPRVIEDYWCQILAGSKPEVRQKVLADLRATPQQTVVGAFKALFQYDPLPSLRSYPGPKLSVITPFNDAPFSLHKIEQDLPHLLVTGTSHWIHMDQPEAFNRIMGDFLVTVDQAAGN